MKTHLIPAALAALVTLAAIPAHAATMSASPSAPVIDGEDIANYSAVSGTDKWWVASGTDSNTKGQSFTTGDSAVRIKAITYQIEGTSATATKTYLIRLGRVTGTVFTQIHAETAVQSAPWNSNESMTWTFDTPVLLQPHTTYGIDVTMVSSTTGWQTGIPYITVSGDDYSGGMKYSSTTSAGGTTSISNAIASDRIFHLDIERPLGPVFELVAPSPADNASDALATRELILTFSQTVTPGSGNLTVRDLTDPMNPIETLIPASDSRLTYDQNVVRIDPTGLLDWNKSYAIRLDAGVFLGDGSAPIAAISDDTTWNFSTLPGDPLLEAIAAIKNHVTGTVTLTGPQIAAHKTTIDDLRQRFAESTATISAVFDLITTYETAKGPLFVSGSTVTDFSRNNTNPADKKSVSPENYHWVVYTVMQHAMDVIYNAPELAEYEAQFTGYKFGSHTNFPGPCSPPADPFNVHNVSINGSFPVTFGRNTQQWTSPARKPTGTYLSPGTIATVTVPTALVNTGYKVRVGAHSWDLSGRAPVKRLERATRLYPINASTIKIASPYGGGIYIEVPIGADAGVVNVTVTGAVRAPYFSAKSFHATTPAEWLVERTHPAPWADFQSDKFMMQVPRKWIYNMTGAQAVQLMDDWDAAMDAINSLMGFDLTRGKETMYCQPDVILRSSVHAPGYPAVNISTNPNSEVSPLGYAGSYLVRGPGASLTAANIEFHEQGHAYGFPKFGGESESNVNLLQPAMLNRAFGKTFDEAQNGSFGGGNSNITMDNTAVAWMCVFNFSPREVPMATAEKAYQHKGHAKFMDVARLFGWSGLDAYWRSFMEDDANSISYGTSTDDLLLRLSRHVGKDIRPLFHFWGIYPENPTALAAAIAAENIPSSIEIRNQLLHYKTLVPADNAAFRSFAQAWRGKVPSINGNWEEREHSRQWDTTALYGAGDQQRSEATNPGEIYNENSALDITNRVQELVDLYFPNAIAPSPMTFATTPAAVNATTIGMVATTATAATGPIDYLFEETSGNAGGDDSGWQASPVYQDSGLTTGLTYSYTVTARDGLGNLTQPSAGASATAEADGTPPSPSTMTFASPPAAVNESSITMTATAATDINGVEYYFDETSGNFGGSDSGWQDSPNYTNTGLSPVTGYTYVVRARDKSAGQNVSSDSAPASANTADIPDTVEPQILTLSPTGPVTDVAANLVATFDEPVVAGNGNITLKNLTDATQSQISINDPSVSIVGSVLTINPASDLLLNKSYAIRIDAGAVADVSSNPFTGISDDSTWSFNVILEDPLADAGGPYSMLIGGSLSLDGSASLPSGDATITTYEWDLDNDGDYDETVTGATPPSIDFATLTDTYGMIEGVNTIQLRVTDSAAKTAAASATVNLLFISGITWDPSGGGTSDGAGTWLDTGVWWDGAANVDWNNATPDDAIIGNGGSGGTITLGAVTAGTVLLDNFTGTYELKNGSLTQGGGFTVGSTAGNVRLTTTTLTGTGGLTMNGPGILFTQGSTLSYSGTTTVTNGTLLSFNNLPSGNVTLNNGLLADYYRTTTQFTGGLGTGANQIQMSGVSGFGAGNGGSTWRIGSSKSVLQWGSTDFNLSILQLQTPADNMGPSIYGQVTLDNGLDLNGAQRTIDVLGLGTNPAKSSGTLTGKIHDATATSAGITKTGDGTLILNAPNDGSTYDGSFVIDGGAVIFGSSYQNTWNGESLPPGVNLKINDGVAAGWFSFSRDLGTGPGELQITGGTSGFTMKQGDRYDFTLDGGAEVVWGSADFNPSVFVLNLNDLAPSSPARLNNPLDLNGADRTVFTDSTATFGNSTAFGDVIGRGGNLAGDIQTSTGTAGLIKTGVGAIALSGTNTYNGGTTISEGSLYFTKIAAMPATGTVTVSDGTTLIVPLGGSGWTTGTNGNGTLGGLLAGDGGQAPSTISYLGTSNLGLVVSGTQTYSGVISSGGNVKTLGDGSLELTEDNTFTGDLIVDGGSTLVLSGDNSGANGDVQIVNGYLEAGTANLSGGALTFNSSGSEPAIWVTSGSLTPTLGSANDVFWNGNGGFAASSSALTVSPNAGAQIDWSAATGFNGKILQLGSPGSTASVEITNDIDIDSNRNISLFDNSATNDDVSILSGNIDGGGSNRNLTIEGSGTLVLSGTNDFGNGILYVGNSGASSVVRATDGIGLPTAAKLYFNNGVLESSGSFTRDIGSGNGQVYWNNKGGFAANGGALTVNLGGAAADINFGANPSGFRGQNPLYLGSPTADNVVTFQNGIILDNNRNINVPDNPDTNNDYAVITGVISQSGNRNLTKDGDGMLVFNGDNSYTGTTTVNGGTLVINGDQTAATGLVDVKSGKTLGGTGTIGGNVTVENTGGLIFDLSTAAGSHDKLDVLGSFTFESASVLTITSSGGASPGTYTLVTAGSAPTGSVPATVNLPVDWTADAPQIVGNDLVINITSTGGGGSAYDTWAGGAVFTDDDNGDGVTNGMAFLLGAADPDEIATDKLPVATETGGGLVLTFYCLPIAARGTATLNVEHSSNLGISDAWAAAEVPNTTGGPVNGVSFVVGAGPVGPPALNSVTATIDSAEAAAGKLFGRLEGDQP